MQLYAREFSIRISENSGPLASETRDGGTQGFNNIKKSKISEDVAKEMADNNEQKLGSLEAVLELALEKRAGVIALERQKQMEVANAVEETIVHRVLSHGQNLEEKFGQGGADMNSRSVQGKNDIKLEMKWDDLGDEFMETEGDGVGDESFLSRSIDGQNLNEIVSEKGGAYVKLTKVKEQKLMGSIEEDLYVLSPRDVKLWQPCFEKRFDAQAQMSENHAKSEGKGVDLVGSQGTKIIVLEENDPNGEVYVSGENRIFFSHLDQYEGENEEHESMDNFTLDDNFACVEFKDTCTDDEHENHRTPKELVNLCIVKYDGPEGYKAREALLNFEEHYEALKKERNERKTEMGEVQKGKRYAHIEAAMRLKAEGKCIYVQKPFGHIPGIRIGDAFQFRAQLMVVGLHSQMICGIDYMTIGDQKFTTCVVDSGRYDNKTKTNDILIYSGQGGNPKIVDKIADLKLIKGNLAMVNSMKMGYPVRVIRGMASYVFNHSKDSKYVYAYDGLYKITKYWKERDQNGSLVFKFELIRMLDRPNLFKLLLSRTIVSSLGNVCHG